MATYNLSQLNSINVSDVGSNFAKIAFSLNKEYFVVFSAVNFPDVATRMDLFKSPTGTIDIEHLDSTTLTIHPGSEPNKIISDGVSDSGNFYALGDGRYVYYQTGTGLDAAVVFIVFNIDGDTINITTPLTYYTFARRTDDGNPDPCDPIMFVIDSNHITFTTVIGSALFTNGTRNLYFQAVKVDVTTNTPVFGTEVKHTVGTHRSHRSQGTGANLDSSRIMFEDGFTVGSSGTPTKRFIIWNHVANTVTWSDVVTTGGWLSQSGANHYYKLSNGKNYVVGGNRPTGAESFDRYWVTYTPPTTLSRNPSYTDSSFTFVGHNFVDDHIAHFRGAYDGVEGYIDFRLDVYDATGVAEHVVNLDIGDPWDWTDDAYAFLDVDRHILIKQTPNDVMNVKLYAELILPGFVKKFNQLTSSLFAGSYTSDGEIDGPVLDARFNNMQEIAALSGSPMRPAVIPNTNRYYTLDDSKVRLIHPCIEQIIIGSEYWIPAEGSWGGYYDDDGTWYADETIEDYADYSLVTPTSEGVSSLNSSQVWMIQTPPDQESGYAAVSSEEFYLTEGDVVQFQGNGYYQDQTGYVNLIVYYSQYLDLSRMDWDTYWVTGLTFRTYIGVVPTDTWIWSADMFRAPYTGKYRFGLVGYSSTTDKKFFLDKNYYLGTEGITTIYESNFNTVNGWTGTSGSSVSVETKEGRQALKITRTGTSATTTRSFPTIPAGSMMYIEFDLWVETPGVDTVSIGYNEVSWGIGSSATHSGGTRGWHTVSDGRQTGNRGGWIGVDTNVQVAYDALAGCGWISNVKVMVASPIPNSGLKLEYPI